VSTKNTPNRVKRTNRRFLFTRADRAFKEVMVYFHIDRAQRYIQELGFNNALNHPISVHIDGQTDDNSFYSPTTKALTFPRGELATRRRRDHPPRVRPRAAGRPVAGFRRVEGRQGDG
jgi:hypothetical protein